MKETKNNLLFFFILFLINFIFFLPLFFPVNKLIITPEYGGGDQIIFHYPIQYLLQKKIRSGNFLLWSNQIGGGYPIYAEQEVGFFNPITLLTLFLFPVTIAVNIQIFIYFLILLLGSYYLGLTIKLKRIAALFFSIIFTYSFFNLANIIHHSHLASFCYIPFIFALNINFLKVNETRLIIKYFSLLVFFLFFQFISGHIQYFFYSIILILLYAFFYLFNNFPKNHFLFKKYLILIFGIFFSLFFSSFQFLPMLEFYWFSFRSNVNYFFSFNMKLKDLLTFFYPFISYDLNLVHYLKNDSAIPPWDGNLFLGFIPLIVFIFSIFFMTKKTGVVFKDCFYCSLFLPIFFLFLAFGDNGPFHFLFAIFPFSRFRVPSRIIFLFLIFLGLYIAKIYETFIKNKNLLIKIIFYLFIPLHVFLNMNLMYKFHDFIDGNQFMSKEKKFLSFSNPERDYFLNILFYEYFIPRKLSDEGIERQKKYIFNLIKKSLVQNFGLFYDYSYFNLPTSAFNLNRHTIYYRLLVDELEKNRENEKISLSLTGINLLSLAGITHIFSPYPIEATQSAEFKLIKKDRKDSIFVYKTGFVKNLPFFASEIIEIKTLNDFIKNLSKFKKGQVFVEDKSNNLVKIKSSKQIFIKVKKITDTDIELESDSSNDAFLVIPINFYPGWRIYTNKKEIKIYRVNFLYFGGVIPKGKQKIEVKFNPISLKLGVLLSSLSFPIFFIFLKKLSNFFQ
jgi:sulfur relay (sulfurtransferase) DsrF/TusC family protein